MLLLMLSSCIGPTELGGTIGYRIFNGPPINGAVCIAGLKGRLMSGETVMFESPVVPLGENYDEQKLRGSIDKGDQVRAEAWCYGATGEEIGYIAAEGVLVPSTTVAVVYNEPYDNPTCLKGSEVRGKPPCIISSIIKQ